MVLPIALGAASASILAATAQITAPAKLPLAARQNTDPAILGYPSSSGASEFDAGDVRGCHSPSTVSRSGSYANCCAAPEDCIIATSCSSGYLLADVGSISCRQQQCNTAVVLPTLGATTGFSILGCYEEAWTMVQDVGSNIISTSDSSRASATGSAIEEDGFASGTTEGFARESAEGFASETSGGFASGTAIFTSSSARSSASPSSSSSPSSLAPKSTGAAAVNLAAPLTGVAGFVAGILALL